MDKLNEENKKFVEAIKRMKEEKTKQSQSIMLGEMMKSKFLNPTTLNITPDKNGNVHIPVGTQISFYTIVSTDKKKFAMAFTDNSELNKWINMQNTTNSKTITKNSVIMNFMDYAEIILDKNSNLDGLVINPYNQNIVFNKEQIASLKEQKLNNEKYGITVNSIKKDEKIKLKKLLSDEYPSDMIDNLICHMKKNENIKTAYIQKMLKDEKESYLIVVDFDGKMNEVLGEIAKIAKPFLIPPISSLDMVSLNSPLGREASKNSDMFYNKAGLQLFTKAKSIEESEIVKNAKKYIYRFFEENYDGHDVYHSLRVYDLAEKIAQEEGADLELVRLSALLHEVDDRKIVGKQKEPFENTKKFLKENNLDEQKIEEICNVISQITFDSSNSLEAKILQDADRLDLIGAIGIARLFSYSAVNKLPMHNPDSEYKDEHSNNEYYSNDVTAINCFYEKLLKVKDLMNTESAKKIAQGRHKYLENFLTEFLEEWKSIK